MPHLETNTKLLDAACAADFPVLYTTPVSSRTYLIDYQGTTIWACSINSNAEMEQWDIANVLTNELTSIDDDAIIQVPRASGLFDPYTLNLFHF